MGTTEMNLKPTVMTLSEKISLFSVGIALLTTVSVGFIGYGRLIGSIEDLRNDMNVMEERIEKRFDKMDERSEKLEDKMDNGFERVDKKIEAIDSRLRVVGQKIERLKP